MKVCTAARIGQHIIHWGWHVRQDLYLHRWSFSTARKSFSMPSLPSLKGAVCSFGEVTFLIRGSSLREQTDLKGQDSFILFNLVYVWRTLPAFLASDSVLGMLFSSENSLFIQSCAPLKTLISTHQDTSCSLRLQQDIIINGCSPCSRFCLFSEVIWTFVHL